MEKSNDESLEWTLIKRSLTEELTTEERLQLETWLNESSAHRRYYDRIVGFDPSEGVSGLSGEQCEEELAQYVTLIRKGKREQQKKHFIIFTRYAAVLFVLLTVGIYFWYQERGVSETSQKTMVLAVKGKIQPILVTEEGTRIELEQQGGLLQKISDGRITSEENAIVYNQPTGGKGQAVAGLHTLIIPRGGEYRVTLADGTIVWLNAETEFSYPVSFTDSLRAVKLKGEAYFEVAKDAKPFEVQVNDVYVRVYGTHFNVNGYDNERVQTVLLSGSVGVSSLKNPGVEQMIRPNEMVEVNVSTGVCEVKTVDAAAYVAWKGGYFSFEQETLEQIMAKLSRWYDVQVVFENEEVRTQRFTGRVDRNENFQGVLNLLQRTLLVKFKVEGNRIIVSK